MVQRQEWDQNEHDMSWQNRKMRGCLKGLPIGLLKLIEQFDDYSIVVFADPNRQDLLNMMGSRSVAEHPILFRALPWPDDEHLKRR
jgi:hypothetical protein